MYPNVGYSQISMFMNNVINNDVAISEIWTWILGQREEEDYPQLRPSQFIDKGVYKRPTEGI